MSDKSRLYKLPKDILIKIIETLGQEYRDKIDNLKKRFTAELEDNSFCNGKDCLNYMQRSDLADMYEEGVDNVLICQQCMSLNDWSITWFCNDCTGNLNKENPTKENPYGVKLRDFYLYNYQTEPKMYVLTGWYCHWCIYQMKGKIKGKKDKSQPCDKGIHLQKIDKGIIYGSECGHVVWDGWYTFSVKSPIKHELSEWYPLIKWCDDCKQL